MYSIIVPFARSIDDKWFAYFVPPSLSKLVKIWQIVSIPFSGNVTEGVIIWLNNDCEISSDKIRSIISIVVEKPLLSDIQVELIKYISERYFILIHKVVNLFIPWDVRKKLSNANFDFLEKSDEYDYTLKQIRNLTPAQEKIYKSLKNKNKKNILFHGITGSWKTEIYIELIKDNLEKNKQSLILVPEIILNSQISDRIKEVFWDRVIIINSNISSAKRTKYWNDIYRDKAKIIIGTRMALFYPYRSLKLIIIDEEHDNSYISDKLVIYDTREVAMKLAKELNTKCILASGTPSIKYMYKVLKKEIYLVSLLQKYNEN